MRIPFLILFFTCLLSIKAWAQPRSYPLSWQADRSSHARIAATTTPYTTTLKLPYFYDFSSRYVHVKNITNGSTVIVNTLRPHGLQDNDTVEISGAYAPTNVAYFTGRKYVSRLSDYQFQLYQNPTLTIPSQSDSLIPYLRIKKLGAQETSIPDTLAFYYNHGGVQINGSSAKNQPSYYVARFDGLDETGVPYSTNPFAVGYTDSLLSQAFDLSSYTVANNIYMSFYYQHGGNGEQPDATDHLYLEFLDNTSQWNVVQDLTGTSGNSVDLFYIAMVPLNDAKYLHSAFQYRFRSYGRQSGAYDVWNVDYIYIDKNRTATDTLYVDFSFEDADASFLKNYTSMPFDHFFSPNNDKTYCKDSLQAIATYQSNIGKSKAFKIVAKDQYGALVSSYIATGTETLLYKYHTYYGKFNVTSFPNRKKPIYIDVDYSLNDDERPDVESSTYERMFNNVLTKRTYLYDYYAYDDGEAEAGFGSNFSGVEIAYQFVSQKKDTLTHVDICFTRNKDLSLEGLQIYLMVWRDTVYTSDPVNNPSELYKEPITIHYPSQINGFVRYPLATPIVIDSAAKFHIGFKKNFPQLLTVGYDRNRDARSKSFYKESTQWAQMLTDVDDPGSMMMRPVFYSASNNVPVPIHPSVGVNKNSLLLYPNPASTTIDIVATEEISELNYVMYSLYGQTVASGTITSTDHAINVASLSGGMYLILCTDAKGKTYSTRFIKE